MSDMFPERMDRVAVIAEARAQYMTKGFIPSELLERMYGYGWKREDVKQLEDVWERDSAR